MKLKIKFSICIFRGFVITVFFKINFLEKQVSSINSKNSPEKSSLPERNNKGQNEGDSKLFLEKKTHRKEKENIEEHRKEIEKSEALVKEAIIKNRVRDKIYVKLINEKEEETISKMV